MTQIQLLEKTELILTQARVSFEVNTGGAQSPGYSGDCQSPQGQALALPNSSFGWCAACLTWRIFSNLGVRFKPACLLVKHTPYPPTHNIQCKQETH